MIKVYGDVQILSDQSSTAQEESNVGLQLMI